MSGVEEVRMKRAIVMSVILSAAFLVEAGAQSTASAGRQAPTQPPTSSAQLTVVGCLRSVDSSAATGTSGASADASRARDVAAGGFMLTNVKAATAPKRAGSAATAAAAETATDAGPDLTSFRLEGSESGLQKYRNSMVEVSGTLDRTKSSDATGSATAGATGQAGPTGSGAAATGTAPERRTPPTLRVTSVRQVAPVCTVQ
jgi:hypothetical protein